MSEINMPANSVWQEVSDRTGTIITPSNLIDVAAFAGAIYGVKNIESTKGSMALVASYAADTIDGPIARKTGTASPLGEKIDAVGDKIKLGYGVLRFWRTNQADKPLLAAAAVQNIANSAITIADQIINETPVLHSSTVGKRSFMLQEVGVGINIAGNILQQKGNQDLGDRLRRYGNVIGYSGVALGAVATAGYLRTLLNSTK